MAVTVPQDLTTLLSYFETGDKPTQDQFEELIRTMFYLYQQTVDAAEAAQAVVTALTGSIPTVWARARYNHSPNTVTLDGAYNASAAVVTSDGLKHVKITFDDAAPDTNYWLYSSVSGLILPTTVKADTYVQCGPLSGSDSGKDFTVQLLAFWQT